MHLSITLFGQSRVKLNNEPVKRFRSNKAEALLIYLVCAPQAVHTREALVDLFWPDQDLKKGFTNLRQTVRRLQQAIDNATAVPPFLFITDETIQFNQASDYECDLHQFQSMLSACPQHKADHDLFCQRCVTGLHDAEALYTDRFLAHFAVTDAPRFDHWLETVREDVHQQGAQLLQKLADYHEQRGEDNQADRYASRIIAINDWDEVSYRQRMRILARQGQRTKALKLYRVLEKKLKAEIGDDVEPEQETGVLYRKIRTTPSDRPHTLPSLYGRPFVGREQELADIKLHLAHPRHRLLTLAGLGGIGKTELALQIGWAAVNDHFGPFTDGVFLIDNTTSTRFRDDIDYPTRQCAGH